MAKAPWTMSDRHYADGLTNEGYTCSPSSDENLACTSYASNKKPVTSNCILKNPRSLAYTPCTPSTTDTLDRGDRLNNVNGRNHLSGGLIKVMTRTPIRSCLSVAL
ncbi:hypothetical protein ACLOJK_036920 [Asimina triloba]